MRLIRVLKLAKFIGYYNLHLKQTGSTSDALFYAIARYTKNPPFNILNDADVENIVKHFILIPNHPVLVGQLMMLLKQQGDASILKDHLAVKGMAEYAISNGICSNAINKYMSTKGGFIEPT